MDVIILAAGQGSRLNINIPKCLITISKHTLIERNLILLRSFNKIKKISIVIGNGGVWNNLYKTKITEISLLYDVAIIINHNSLISQSVESLKIGLNTFTFVNNDLLVLDADIFFTKKLLLYFLQATSSSILISNSFRTGSKVFFSRKKNKYTLLDISDSNKSKYIYSGFLLISSIDLPVALKVINTKNYIDKLMFVFINDLSKSFKIDCVIHKNNYFSKYNKGLLVNINTNNDLFKVKNNIT
jgi:choline kinase